MLMKSRINPRTVIPQKIVGYCIDVEKKKKLMEIAMELNINICFVGTESAGETVGFLSRIIGFDKTGKIIENPPECEVVIMSGLKNNIIDKFLKMSAENDASVELKCVVTSVNQLWELHTLIDELKKEHEKMHGKK